jgi:hypothetical protein
MKYSLADLEERVIGSIGKTEVHSEDAKCPEIWALTQGKERTGSYLSHSPGRTGGTARAEATQFAAE